MRRIAFATECNVGKIQTLENVSMNRRNDTLEVIPKKGTAGGAVLRNLLRYSW